MIFILSFIPGERPLLPESVQELYTLSRVGIQIPILMVMLATTFIKKYKEHHHLVLFVAVLLITLSNFYFSVYCWVKAEYRFSYEGVFLYALYAAFIFRLSFRYYAAYALTSLVVFIVINFLWDLAGEFTSIRIGFVTLALGACTLGVYQIELGFKRVRKANNELKVLSETDTMTGLLNRRTFTQKADALLSSSVKTEHLVSVFLVDIDFFKDYNDGYGHPAGDAIIVLQADMLKTLFSRENDLVARYGGEEFIVLSVVKHCSDADKLAQNIIDCWKNKSAQHGKGKGEAFVSCSVGYFCAHAEHISSLQSATIKADTALYKAKESGRGQAIRYT